MWAAWHPRPTPYVPPLDGQSGQDQVGSHALEHRAPRRRMETLWRVGLAVVQCGDALGRGGRRAASCWGRAHEGRAVEAMAAVPREMEVLAALGRAGASALATRAAGRRRLGEGSRWPARSRAGAARPRPRLRLALGPTARRGSRRSRGTLASPERPRTLSPDVPPCSCALPR